MNEGDTKSYGEAAHSNYYYKIPVSCLGMDDHPDLSPPRTNCPTGLSETYSGDNSLDDDSDGSDPVLDGLKIGLVADDGFDATNRTCVGVMVDARGNRVHVPTEISATDEELHAMRQSVSSVFDDDSDGWVTDEDNAGATSCSGPGRIAIHVGPPDRRSWVHAKSVLVAGRAHPFVACGPYTDVHAHGGDTVSGGYAVLVCASPGCMRQRDWLMDDAGVGRGLRARRSVLDVVKDGIHAI